MGAHSSGFCGAAAADDQHVEAAAVLAAVQPQPNVTGEDFVLLLGKLAVYLPGRAPGGGAVFLAIPGAPAAGKVHRQPQHINAGADKNRRSALLRPMNFGGCLHGRRQPRNHVHKTSAPAGGNQQRCPENQWVEKEAEEQVPCLGGFTNGITSKWEKPADGAG